MPRIVIFMENGGGMTGSCRGLDEGEWEAQGLDFHLQTDDGGDREHKRTHVVFSRCTRCLLAMLSK